MSSGKAAAALLAVFALLLWGLSLRVGVTYDEPPYLAVSSLYRAGTPGTLAREYPPLPSYARAAALAPLSPVLPGAPAGLEKRSFSPHEWGQLFLFRNAAPARDLIAAARRPSILASLLLGGLVALWGGVAALALLILEPNTLAHGSLATVDVFAAAFSVAALWAWTRFLEKGKERDAWLAGAAAGLAIASKATGLGLLPALALSQAWTKGKKLRTRDALGLGRALLAALAVGVAFYAPTGARGFLAMLAFRSRQMSEPSPTWFFGAAYPEGHPLYYPGLLLVKTSLPLLLLAAWGVRGWAKEKPASFKTAASALLVLLGAALLGKRQMGVRHVLLVYPLLCLAAGSALSDLWKRRRLAAAAAFLWHGLSSLNAFPNELAYVNELGGGPSHGLKLLGDSNLDWGQALPELADFVKDHPGGLILSYFGRDCASAYGLVYQDAFSTPAPCPGNPIRLRPEEDREWLAVGATKWQGFYEPQPPSWLWLRSRKPYAVLANAMLVYDVTGDADAHENLARMYAEAGWSVEEDRERKRAKLLKSRIKP